MAAVNSRLSLVHHRQKLSAAITAFHKAAEKHIPAVTVTTVLELRGDPTDLGVEWDEFGETSDDEDAQSEIDPLQPETQPIALPSTLGLEFLQLHGLSALADKERKLREGQLNDALQAVRTGIGYKSLLYRTKVRQAGGYRAKLRSFDEVHVADETVRKHVRIYMQARKAMERLFDPRDVAVRDAFMEKYKPIVKEDLKAETTVLEVFTPGLRNLGAAWFWSLEDNEAAAGSAWMRDCKSLCLNVRRRAS